MHFIMQVQGSLSEQKNPGTEISPSSDFTRNATLVKSIDHADCLMKSS